MARMNDGAAMPVAQLNPPAWSLEPIAENPSAVKETPVRPPAAAGASDWQNWAPAGPGWHDSSWLLRQGLEVTEHRSPSVLENLLRALQRQSQRA
jgi:hypothetical protein